MSLPLGDEPLVSVVVTLYNGAQYVGACLESILAQDYRNFEVLVADDSSGDGSLDVVAQFDDPRLRLLPALGSNIGLQGNWSRAYRAASGTYLKHVCHDDLLEPDCLARQVAMLEANPSAALACGRRRIIDERGGTIVASRGMGSLASDDGPGIVAGDLVAKACVKAGTNLLGEPASVLIRTAMLPEPLFDPKWSYTIDLALYLHTVAGRYAVCDRSVVSSFRVSTQQLSAVLANSQARELRALFGVLQRCEGSTISRLDVAKGVLRSASHARARRVLYRFLGLRKTVRGHGRERHSA